jgi:hypothetical protein
MKLNEPVFVSLANKHQKQTEEPLQSEASSNSNTPPPTTNKLANKKQNNHTQTQGA